MLPIFFVRSRSLECFIFATLDYVVPIFVRQHIIKFQFSAQVWVPTFYARSICLKAGFTESLGASSKWVPYKLHPPG